MDKGRKLVCFLILLFFSGFLKNLLKASPEEIPKYPWKTEIITTVFWIGQGAVIPTSSTNYKSAWDGSWESNYGGKDDPLARTGLLPSQFAATLNPFYIALPVNDLISIKKSRKYIPWWKEPKNRKGRWKSQCKGRWVEVYNRKNRKRCFAQWEDVGPFVTDDYEYVFGKARPRCKNRVGLDVSPAVHDYLGLTGRNPTDWRFVDAKDVKEGPWLKYAEQAIIYSAIKRKNKETDKRKKNNKAKMQKKN